MTFEFKNTGKMMSALPTVYCLGQNRFGQFKNCMKHQGAFDS